MEKYEPAVIEPKWEERWEKAELYRAVDFDKRPKKYILIEFPYPSGERLHVGHGRSYCALDAYCRKLRMQGFNVLYPIGWDAFGLPAENYAIKTGINPAITTAQNIKNAKEQAIRWGLSFDWSREINTTDPKYYKWTQWIFLKMLEKGLAYRADVAVNWCPECKTNLADEEVLADGTHERCGQKTEKRMQKQWLLKITAYADRLLEDLKLVNYLPKIAQQQINWIGRSEGVEIKFEISEAPHSVIGGQVITVFTTAHDTIFGATFMVLSPEYGKSFLDLVPERKRENLSEYIERSLKKSELERQAGGKVKTGMEMGFKVINPFTKKEIPVFVADYVLAGYGTGAIMGVPAHDARDHEFAKKYNLPIIPVIQPHKTTACEAKIGGDGFWDYEEIKTKFADESVLFNSGFLDGLSSNQAKKRIEEEIVKRGIGKKVTNYHLRDWVFSRQHYWGEPIPVIYCRKCLENEKLMRTTIDGVDYAIIPVPEDQLPVELPYVENYKPTGTGESPLAAVKEWVNVACPKCGGAARRETDTMPNWAGSNWYYVAYVIAHKLQTQISNVKTQNYERKIDKKTPRGWQAEALAKAMTPPMVKETGNIFLDNKDLLNYWLPVDLYNGGMEHTTLHLLYSRFIYKFLYDLGVVPTPEPYARRHSHGVVLGPDGAKMSKSRGNVINPDEVVAAYGADTFRLYEMFMGPFEQMIAWSEEGVMGCHRFLKRVWILSQTRIKDFKTPQNLLVSLNKTVKKVSEDLDNLKFNTAIAAMMEFLNLWAKPGNFLNKKEARIFLQILAPFAPHITEELWQQLTPESGGERWSIHQQPWPKYDKRMIEEETVTIVVEVNGKVRDKIQIKREKLKMKNEIEKLARESEKVKKHLAGKKVKQVIFIPAKLINFVT